MSDNKLNEQILRAIPDASSDSTSEEALFKRVTLPPGIKNKLPEVDFNRCDVLVGSFGSVKQFNDNLAKKYYYVPAKYIEEDSLPIRYIALFQSKTMFGSNAGIRYYGEVTLTKKVARKDIRFPMRKNNPDELYYAFGVKEWMKLPIPISVQFETVFEPRFTCHFLLFSCTQSYELFNIHSARQFNLLHELKRMYSEASAFNGLPFEAVRCTNDDKSLWTHDGYIDVLNSNGERMIDPPLSLTDFEKDPKKCFCMISDILGIY